jgi:hypothetical protein
MIFKRAVAQLRAQNWVAITIELIIVTLGVLIALAAQQWAEDRSWDGKVKTTQAAIRSELAEHYSYAVEFRVVYPCMQGQLDRLRNRLMSSGDLLEPAPIYREDEQSGSGINLDFVLRTPIKYYASDAWEEAINDGVVQRLEPPTRRLFAGYYVSLAEVVRLNAAKDEDTRALVALARPVPLDPSVRYSLLSQIERLSGRLQWLDILNGQVIDTIERMGMIPAPAAARSLTMRFGTYQFCKRHDFPMRSFKEAMQAVPG